MIEQDIAVLVREAIDAAGDLSVDDMPSFDVQRPKQRDHGDWSTNAALALQRALKRPPREIAERIVAHLPARDWVRSVEIAGPGFINFHLASSLLHDAVRNALERGSRYGMSDEGDGSAVNVEFVSINPTGPLHIGSARNAALGDAIARLLEHTGYKVTREYYFNDAGSQMTNFGRSVAARYLELLGRDAAIPEDGYRGTYVVDLARRILDEDGDRYADMAFEELGELMRERSVPIVKDQIRVSLERFRVYMDVWFNERDLYESGKVSHVIERLDSLGYVYEHEGAKWLKATELGDTRDRVLVRSFGTKEPTYLVPDLAYHSDKADRGFATMIVVLGADHHAQGPSIRAGMKVLGVEPERIEVVIYQWVHTLRSGETLAMSKRAGEYVALDELIDEVGTDAARYTLLHTTPDNTIYFDIEEVKKQSMDNPVYYVQYGHARIASILRRAAEQNAGDDNPDLDLLKHDAEVELMRQIAALPETVSAAARARAPHRIARYAEELARRFHSFYDTPECRVMSDDPALTAARLALCRATKQTLANALGLLGVSAPDRMEREAA